MEFWASTGVGTGIQGLVAAGMVGLGFVAPGFVGVGVGVGVVGSVRVGRWVV